LAPAFIAFNKEAEEEGRGSAGDASRAASEEISGKKKGGQKKKGGR
jgi:hypothetical protein